MTNSTSNDIAVTTFNEAQLFWDISGADAGWVLRYRDGAGDEQLVDIGETKDADAGLETLARLATVCAPSGATGDIAVYRGDRKAGRITLRDGSIEEWRAL